MKIVLFYEGSPPQASPGHCGAGSYSAFLVTNPLHRKPRQGGGVDRNGE